MGAPLLLQVTTHDQDVTGIHMRSSVGGVPLDVIARAFTQARASSEAIGREMSARVSAPLKPKENIPCIGLAPSLMCDSVSIGVGDTVVARVRRMMAFGIVVEADGYSSLVHKTTPGNKGLMECQVGDKIKLRCITNNGSPALVLAR
ncbi:hypothetical protein PTSG_03377 [Salpingoeca rosetta]|uniref:Uncharacterized protein n=1 Tax=Salpingoeca rosetta (strain ATCC 50818 / BSB-021) TaxID=946362 RepID=F2U511_SALR5|nr:uncharacterized protein PTSG_03377 [Salpingoeca rosetta]EGD82727.1 hypothetical protein PTSG_03377 [Salpingoeca rosetta]|eukprot:XP_004995963.1 hypothetical protein PTSG_03377 [Salpingoeca rosetta]